MVNSLTVPKTREETIHISENLQPFLDVKDIQIIQDGLTKEEVNDNNFAGGSNQDLDPEDDQLPVSFCKFTGQFYSKALPLTLLRSSNFVLNLVGYILIGLKSSESITSGFGVGNASYLFFNYVLTMISGECMSIFVSKYYGKLKWRNIRLTFLRGLFLNIIILIFGIAFIVRLD